jgi:hypothetical protein
MYTYVVIDLPGDGESDRVDGHRREVPLDCRDTGALETVREEQDDAGADISRRSPQGNMRQADGSDDVRKTVARADCPNKIV